MKTQSAWLVMCLLVFVVSAQETEPSTTAFSDKSLTSDDIDRLLAETESIRTSDFSGFTRNLSILADNGALFSAEQECSYRFLNAYKLALTGDVQGSLGHLLDIKNDCDYQSIRIRVDSLLANIYAISGDYQQALGYLDEIVSEIDHIDDEVLILLIYSTAYVVYDLVNQNELSLDFAQISIDRNPSPKQLCSASVYKYISLIKLARKGLGEVEINQVLEQCRKQNENLIAEALNVNWIDYQLNQSQNPQDIEAVHAGLLAAEEAIVATRYKNLIVFKDSLMARVLEKLGEPEQAINYAMRALEGTVSLGDSKQKIDALDVLINYHQDQANHQQANEYLQQKIQAEVKFYTEKQEKIDGLPNHQA